ncbi:MAG TPA: helix-turn-helix transcriptional regulator [Acidimicrobiales bacterium]|nr:helix-turn-helix transcriptional regulator [Acidimicrobiales bacterium]
MSDVGDDDDEPDIPLDLWAALVYEARRGRRMTQPQLARAAGVAQQTISKLERGRLCPHDRVKLRLAPPSTSSPRSCSPGRP